MCYHQSTSSHYHRHQVLITAGVCAWIHHAHAHGIATRTPMALPRTCAWHCHARAHGVFTALFYFRQTCIPVGAGTSRLCVRSIHKVSSKAEKSNSIQNSSQSHLLPPGKCEEGIKELFCLGAHSLSRAYLEMLGVCFTSAGLERGSSISLFHFFSSFCCEVCV